MTVHRIDLRFAALAVVLGIAAGCSGTAAATRAAAPAAKPVSRTVTAIATGKSVGVPDNLMADVSVHVQGASAAAVLADDSSKTQSLIDLLGAAGISPKDVQTTSVNLGPNYDTHGRITGYSADNTIRVTFRDLKTAGTRLDSLVGRAGNAATVNGITLGFNDPDALTAQARADAVRRASNEASEMAKAAGAGLGRVRTIAEITATSPMPSGYALRSNAPQSQVAIAPGSQELNVQVKVVFELQ